MNKTIEGNLTRFNASAGRFTDFSPASQTGHDVGAFACAATASEAVKTGK